ncbi:MAG: hypothetical protein JWQ73_2607 [Variovorax sp.]|nr:hypothetical protein [Variovorax sp.]
MPASEKSAPGDINLSKPAESAMDQTSEAPSGIDAQMAPGPRSQGAKPSDVETDPQGREQRIREAAYAAYERRGPGPGNEIDDWLEAERSVDTQAS